MKPGDGLAITDKGRTAAEMMVFARYVMFSEVYWHHAVRCATAMLQRAFYLLHDALDLDALFRQPENDMILAMRAGRGHRPGRRTARRPVRPGTPPLQTVCPVQRISIARPVPPPGAAPLYVARRLRRAPRRPAAARVGRGGAAARGPVRFAAGQAGSAIQRRNPLPEGSAASDPWETSPPWSVRWPASNSTTT